MTIIAAAARGPRVVVADHIYSLPVVRELPFPPPAAVHDRTW